MAPVCGSRYVIGPGPSGTSKAITNNPGRESRVLRRRIDEVQANMQRTVEGIKQLAEVAGMTLRVGIGAAAGGSESVEFVRQAERLGVDSVWVRGVLGRRCIRTTRVPGRAHVHHQVGDGNRAARRAHPGDARHVRAVPASAVRRPIRLGIGTSGPQVMEGWHGVPFDRPMRRTRETIEIIRSITAGERLDYHGELYRLPLAGRLKAGRSARCMPPMLVPIYVASLGPANLRLTGELADGWIGNSPSSPRPPRCSSSPSARAPPPRAACSPTSTSPWQSAVEFTDDVEAAGRRHAEGYAFTIRRHGIGHHELL